MLHHCFFCVFSVCFAVCLLLFVLLCVPSPLLELCPAVLCHPCCCVCHICTACAVVPGVSPCVCVSFRAFFEVAVYFLLLLLLLSPVVLCFLASGGVWFVSSWFRCVLGVAPGVWCVLLLVCVVLLFFCLCWFWCVLVGPLFFWLVVVVVLLCPLFCSWWSCSAVVVAGVFPLLCVAPSWC